MSSANQRATRWPSDAALLELEEKVLHAFSSGDEAGLSVIGYGEISAVLALHTDGKGFACKRLPPFSSRHQLESYSDCFTRYLERLAERNVHVVPTTLMTVEGEGASVLYCIQPLLDPATLAVNSFRRAETAERRRIAQLVYKTVIEAAGPSLGIDGQLSNWVVQSDGTLRYLDITTPLMRDARGDEQLDVGLFIASLPWALRSLVKRLLLGDILSTYYDPKKIIIDFLGNLIKEGLTDEMDQLVADANDLLGKSDGTPITVKQVQKHYQSDARTWSLLLALRRADRSWQRRIRRKSYPFLLPGPIER